MGSSHSDISESEFNKSWRVVETVDYLTVWENRDNPAHQLEQYYVRDPEDANTRKLYTLRKHSPYLVGAYILRNDGFGCCTDRQGSTSTYTQARSSLNAFHFASQTSKTFPSPMSFTFSMHAFKALNN